MRFPILERLAVDQSTAVWSDRSEPVLDFVWLGERRVMYQLVRVLRPVRIDAGAVESSLGLLGGLDDRGELFGASGEHAAVRLPAGVFDHVLGERASELGCPSPAPACRHRDSRRQEPVAVQDGHRVAGTLVNSRLGTGFRGVAAPRRGQRWPGRSLARRTAAADRRGRARQRRRSDHTRQLSCQPRQADAPRELRSRSGSLRLVDFRYALMYNAAWTVAQTRWPSRCASDATRGFYALHGGAPLGRLLSSQAFAPTSADRTYPMNMTMFTARGLLYAVMGTDYVRATLTKSGTADVAIIDRAYPEPVAAFWLLPPSFGNELDAAFQVGDNCYFFRGTGIVRHVRTSATGAGTPDNNFKKSVTDLAWRGFGSDGIDAIVDTGAQARGLAFSGDQYIAFTITGPGNELGPIQSGFPQPISTFPWKHFGAEGVESVVLIDGRLYVFARGSYIVVREQAKDLFVMEEDPQPVGEFLQIAPARKRVGELGPRWAWMANIASRDLLTVNLPGTHDSGAVNAWLYGPWSTQDLPVYRQLSSGIRLLDIRLRASMSGSPPTLELDVVHGKHGLGSQMNVYGPFVDLAKDCAAFLAHNPTETIVMLVRVEVWDQSYTANRNQVIPWVASELPVLPSPFQLRGATVGHCAGKVVLLHNIYESRADYFYLQLPDNTSGEYATNTSGSLPVYVQDKYEGLPLLASKEKLRLVLAAAQQGKPAPMLLNFASATRGLGLLGVYVNDVFMTKMLNPASQQKMPRLGWILFDYASYEYMTTAWTCLSAADVVIASNESRPYQSLAGLALSEHFL